MAQNGKAFNEYMHQATPDSKVERFSDKPINVAGVRYSPKWAWSDGYRKIFRAAHRDQPPKSWGYGNTLENTYRDWLRCERMPNLTPDEAEAVIRNQRNLAA